VRIKHPVEPFLHYMASSWDPKIISPKVLAGVVGKDHAQTWAKEHASGTGPPRSGPAGAGAVRAPVDLTFPRVGAVCTVDSLFCDGET
jgi:hypothetical protein